MDNTINRRDFIKHTTTVTVGMGLGAGALLAACGSGGAGDAAQADGAPATGTGNSAKATLAKRMLGALEVTELGLGCMNIAWAYGPSTGKDASIALVRKAYESGIRFFDTAEIYGPFISEQIVGEALEPYRNEVVLASKIGFDIDFETGEQHGLTSRPEHIRLAVEQMLKRLRTDRIDLLYQHRVDPQVPIEEVAGAMAGLIKEGKIRHYGLSEAGAATIRRAHKEHPVTAVQNEYSFWTRDPEAEVIPACEELGIGFVPWSPLGMGYLTGKVTPEYSFSASDLRTSMHFPRFTAEAMVKNRPLVELLGKVGGRHEASPGRVALAWLLARKPFIVPIPGTRLIPHMQENTAALKVRLTADDMRELEDGFARIGVFGDRAPAGLKEAHDIGTSLGTTSKGTHGKTPLPKQ